MAQKAAALESVRKVDNWIDGRRVPSASGATADVFNSATGEVCARVAMSTAAETGAAVDAAAAAFPAWSRTPVLKRAKVMFRLQALIERDRDEIAALITEEHGKVLHDAQGSVQRGLAV